MTTITNPQQPTEGDLQTNDMSQFQSLTHRDAQAALDAELIKIISTFSSNNKLEVDVCFFSLIEYFNSNYLSDLRCVKGNYSRKIREKDLTSLRHSHFICFY